MSSVSRVSLLRMFAVMLAVEGMNSADGRLCSVDDDDEGVSVEFRLVEFRSLEFRSLDAC